MLKQRILTALVLAVIVVWAVLELPAVGFGVALLVVILPGAWEWARLAGWNGARERLWYVAAVLALILLSWPLLGKSGFIGALLVAVVGAWCGALVWLRRYAGRPERSRPMTVAVAGLVVLAAPWAALMALRADYGPRSVVFLLLLVWAADIGAYFAGRRWGRRKLAPVISPGKTWEGALGGGLATLVLALVGAAFLKVGASGFGFVAVCLITMGFSIAGDLFESMMKRQSGLKDSGSLLPGHGGVLDRVDSLSAAAPVFLLGLYGIGP